MRDARVADIADIDALFSTKTLPSEWDKASAVILVHYSKYYVETQDGKPAFGAYSKTRVLLNDAFAVNDFSSFTLDEDEWLEVKVIKKDGKVIELDPSRAVKGDVRVVNRKKKLDFSFTTNVRIPVPSLEVGDIIEYERFWENKYIDAKGKEQRKAFKERFNRIQLTESYPVLLRVMDFDIASPFVLKWLSKNEAPEIKELSSNSVSKQYRFKDEERAAVKGEYWTAKYQELPFVKFAIVDAAGNVKMVNEKSLGAYSDDWFIALAKETLNNKAESHSHVYLDYIKQHEPKRKSEYEVRSFYEYYRRKFFLLENSPNDEMANKRFIQVMSRILKKWNIEHEVIIAMPKHRGTLQEVVSDMELYWAIRLPSGDILGEFDAYSAMNTFYTRIYGTEYYAFDTENWTLKKEKLEQMKPEENVYSHRLNVNLSGSVLEVEQENSFSGFSRYAYLSDLPAFIYNSDYIDLYGKYYGVVSFSGYKDPGDLLTLLTRIKKRYWRYKFDLAGKRLVSHVRSPYYSVKNYSLQDIEDGARSIKDPRLEYSETFNAHGLVSIADSSIIIDIGRFLGSSFDIIDSEDTIRETGIDFRLPRRIEQSLYFNIPDGYEIAGGKDLDTLIENSTGSFEVNFINDGMGIKIKTTRTYASDYYPKEYWDEVVEIVKASARTNEKRIVLIKKTK